MFTGWNDIDRMFQTLDFFRNRMNRLMTGIEDSGGNYLTYFENWPRANLYDAEENLTLMAEVPGLSEKDLDIRIQGRIVEILGERKIECPEGYSLHRSEREATKFSRSITLPLDIEVDKVTATIKDGILTLTLPKAEAAKPRQITIQEAA